MKFKAPEWIPEIEWKAFVEMRKKMRRPLTPHACDLIVKKLSKAYDEGFNPAELLNAAIEHGWLTVWTPNGGTNGNNRTRSADDANKSATRLLQGLSYHR